MFAWNIPKDKIYPADAVQCDNCGGWGCKSCKARGWFTPSTHPKGRTCALTGCGNPIPPNQIAVYCSTSCAVADAK